MFDVIVIGGGVIGGTVLRELTKYRLNVCLVEKEDDVCMGQSKANSGIVHAGYDAQEGTLKAKFNVLGNRMMESYCRELGVKYKNNGSLVVAFSQEDFKTVAALKERGERNGVGGLRLLTKEEIRALEPNISSAAEGALLAPTGGIVCPYTLTIAAIGNAMDNGAKLFTNFEVTKITKENGEFTVESKGGQSIRGKVLINCAGLASGKIAALAGDRGVRVFPRKGEYVLLDRESGGFVSHTVFFTPTVKGKGVLISPTVDGNLIVGPTAAEQDGTDTSAQGIAFVNSKSKEMCPRLPLASVITSFAGVRAYSDRHDFIIEESAAVAGLIHCAGIESPGLTSAPAIAKYVAEELVSKHFNMDKNASFNPYRPSYAFQELSTKEKNEIIARDGAFGKIVCRCEQITEGEIVQAIKVNPPARNLDAVKRRTRTGMGRCQGGFCQPQVAQILARELNLPLEEVTKSGGSSNLVTGVIK